VARSSQGKEGGGGPEVVDLRRELSGLHPRNWRERFGGPDRYGVLLLLILITIVTSVVLRDNEWERLVAVAMVAVMLLFALRTSQASKRLQRFALCFVPVVVVGTALAASRRNEAEVIRVSIAVITTLLLLAVLFAIVHRLLTHLTISWPTILGALCIYLVFGMVFASAYAVAGHLQDNMLFAQQDGFTSADTLYFSLVTLTTVGFGDLTMRTDGMRIMSAMEALLGQVYLITAVGLLIGNLGRTRQPRRAPDDRPKGVNDGS
jgi:voltage-gated potassium channel